MKLRIALLSTLELTEPDRSMPRAFLEIGGISIARQQLGLALSMGCERIVCLAKSLTPELIALQHEAETRGAQFQAISAPRALNSLVTVADEVVVLADGLLVEADIARDLLNAGPVILTLAADLGEAAGFERIDLATASAGAFRVPGRLIDKLNDLPSDADVISALLRIALQAGIPTRTADTAGGSGHQWTLVRSEEAANALESSWFARQLERSGPNFGGSWLTRYIAFKTGPALLHLRGGTIALDVGAAVLLLLGIGSGWFGFAPLGLLFCAIAWLAQRIAKSLEAVERRTVMRPQPKVLLSAMFVWIVDGALVLLTGWGSYGIAQRNWIETFFPSLMLVALLTLVPRLAPSRWLRLLEDRAIVSLGLIAVVASGYGQVIVPVLSSILVLAGILWPIKARVS